MGCHHAFAHVRLVDELLLRLDGRAGKSWKAARREMVAALDKRVAFNRSVLAYGRASGTICATGGWARERGDAELFGGFDPRGATGAVLSFEARLMTHR